VTITQKFCSMRLSEYPLQESKLPKEQSSPNLDFKSSEINTQKSTHLVLKTPKINIHSVLPQKIQEKIPNRPHHQPTQKLTQRKKSITNQEKVNMYLANISLCDLLLEVNPYSLFTYRTYPTLVIKTQHQKKKIHSVSNTKPQEKTPHSKSSQTRNFFTT